VLTSPRSAARRGRWSPLPLAGDRARRTARSSAVRGRGGAAAARWRTAARSSGWAVQWVRRFTACCRPGSRHLLRAPVPECRTRWWAAPIGSPPEFETRNDCAMDCRCFQAQRVVRKANAWLRSAEIGSPAMLPGRGSDSTAGSLGLSPAVPPALHPRPNMM